MHYAHLRVAVGPHAEEENVKIRPLAAARTPLAQLCGEIVGGFLTSKTNIRIQTINKRVAYHLQARE